MGEIICHNCNSMYWHLDFHFNGLRTCPECNYPLGQYCDFCKERICDSCYLGHCSATEYEEEIK